MTFYSLIGARPQFVKAAMLSRALRDAQARQIIIHSGQHYDENMSAIFFDEMEIPRPDYNLEIGSGSHAFQTGEIMIKLEALCIEQPPDALIVYGDTNTTLAGALVAAKLHIPIAHVEAGLRSFDRTMPEETNRVVADRLSTWLFCPTDTAVHNLRQEGLTQGVHNVGDIMYDAVLYYTRMALGKSRILEALQLPEKGYLLTTIHRDFNTDDIERLTALVQGLMASRHPIVFPVHPRTRKQLDAFNLLAPLRKNSTIHLIEPVGYLDMLRLQQAAKAILTDSGGMQKEAYFLNVPCLTLRPSTEWVETVKTGWNRLIKAETASIVEAIETVASPASAPPPLFGHGRTGKQITDILSSPSAKPEHR